MKHKADTIWKNQRYGLFIEYWSLKPPPFNIMFYIWELCKKIICKYYDNTTNTHQSNATIYTVVSIDDTESNIQNLISIIIILKFYSKQW